MIQVTGSLQTKKDSSIYYAVLNYRDENNKRHNKWISTKIRNVKGNKRLAERKLENLRAEFEKDINSSSITLDDKSNMLFSDFMLKWLEIIKPSVELTTFGGYSRNIKKRICPYFKKLGVTLQELKPYHIQNYYNKLLKDGLKGSTVRRYHANIRKALEYAVKTELIQSNPSCKVDLPKQEQFIGTYYNESELKLFFEKLKGELVELPLLIISYYGLRRSEVLGLKWDAIDFEAKTIKIKHTVSEVSIDGKHTLVLKDKTKNLSSYRTLPLIPHIEELLLIEKERQKKNKELFKKSYLNKDNYICVKDDGSLIMPDYLTRKFPHILKDNGLKHIRLHDLRHSCASLLLANGVSMKIIQEWLGHSSYNTTANIYTHLDTNSKVISANVISTVFNKTA